MRFSNENLIYNDLGKTRKVKKFLLWPKHFGRKKVRWLEKAVIVERVVHDKTNNNKFVWNEIDFDDDEDTW